MRLKELSLSNFLSFTEDTRIDLEKQGLIGVVGSNGQGKSTILEAIVWAFYGETLRGYKGDEVINNKVGENCIVSLKFSDFDQEYEIIRTRKAKKQRKPNDLRFFVNGTETSQASNKQTQESISSTLGTGLSTFCQSVLLSDQSDNFCNLTDAAQKSILEEILQIDTIRKARDSLREKIRSFENDLSFVNKILNESYDYKNSLTYRHDQLQRKWDDFEKNQIEKQNKLEKDIAEIKKSLKTIDKKKEDMERLGRELTEVNKEVEEEDRRVSELTEEAATLSKKINEAKSASNNKIYELDSDINRIKRFISETSELAGRICPTCNQIVDVSVAEDQVKDWEQEIASLEEKKAKISNLLDKFLEKQEGEGTKIQAQIETARENLATTREEAYNISLKINELTVETSQENFFKDRLEKLNEDLGRREENPFTDLIDSLNQDFKENERKLQTLKNKKKSLEIDIEYYRFWDHGFGNQGLKSFILDNAVPFLNRKANEYAKTLTGGSLRIDISTQTRLKNGDLREKFNVSVINSEGSEVYKGNSSGEKRRADIAIGWALADLAASRAKRPIKFRALDEPFENLDEEGIESVFKLLNKASTNFETVLCITHNKELKSLFPKIWEIHKDAEIGTRIDKT